MNARGGPNAGWTHYQSLKNYGKKRWSSDRREKPVVNIRLRLQENWRRFALALLAFGVLIVGLVTKDQTAIGIGLGAGLMWVFLA